MSLVGEIINKVCNASASALGMNTRRGALQILQKTRKILLFAPGTELDPSREFNDAYIQELQVDGKLLIADGIQNFEENGSDDTLETKVDDTQTVTNEGKYKFLVTFNKGIYGNKQAHSIKGFGRFNTGFIDAEGNWLLTKGLNNSAKGYTTGMIQPGKYKFASNSTGEESSLMFQWLDRFEFDTNYAFIPSCEFGGDGRLLEGISEVSLSFVNTPVNMDTTVTFDAVLDQDQKTALEGLATGDVEVLVDGVVAASTIAAVGGFPQRYTATIAALATGEKVDIRLKNTADSKLVIVKDSYLYKSEKTSILVA